MTIPAYVFAIFGAAAYAVGTYDSGSSLLGALIAIPPFSALAVLVLAGFLSNAHSSGFVAVPAERVRTHRLYGIKGTLRLFQWLCGIFALVSPFLYVTREYGEYMRSFTAAIRRGLPLAPQAMIVDMANATLHVPPGLYFAIYVLLAAAVYGLGLVCVCVLLTRRSPVFRSLYTAMAIVTLPAQIAAVYVIGQVSSGTAEAVKELVALNIISSVIPTALALFWTIYLFRSRRVNVTVFSSVRQDDPLAAVTRRSAEKIEPPFVNRPLDTAAPRSVAERLEAIRDLHARGLISAAEYADKRRAILEAL